MYLVYLGESGDTGTSTNDPNQPHHVRPDGLQRVLQPRHRSINHASTTSSTI